MDRETLESYLLTTQSLESRINYDLQKTPILKIQSLEKTDNNYQITGILYIDLGIACKEKNYFECILSFSPEKVRIHSKIQTINQFLTPTFNHDNQRLIKGEPTLHLDTFRLIEVNHSEYIIHEIDNEQKVVHNIEEDPFKKLIAEDMRKRQKHMGTSRKLKRFFARKSG